MKISEMFDIEDTDGNFRFEMLRAQGPAYTFDDPKVMKLVRSLVEGPSVVNLYAGKNIVYPNEIRVDSRSFMFDLTHPMSDGEFIELSKKNGWRFQTFIYDPPWDGVKSKRKAEEFYNGASGRIGVYTRYRDDIVSLLAIGGVIITCCHEIDVFGEIRGMKIEEGYVINPSGEGRPFFVIKARRIK